MTDFSLGTVYWTDLNRFSKTTYNEDLEFQT